MDFKITISIIIFFTAIIRPTSSACDKRNYDSACRYEVWCVGRAGSVTNPSCNYVEPNVTFIIVNSNENFMSAGFFSSTNFDSRVRQIKVVNSTWGSIEGETFRYFSKCVNMNLSNSEIVYIKNKSFWSLAYLKVLDLSYNNIESLPSKTFNIGDSVFMPLEELNLSNNKLQCIGDELYFVSRLKKLYLQNNKLSSLADNAFVNLNDLSELYLQQNHLTSVNLSLVHLKHLKYLDISYNHLIKLSGYQINRLESIVDFNVSHNDLASIDYNCFEVAVHLSEVDFSFNKINITITKDMFINNRNLTYLNFYNNQLIGLEENAFKNFNLKYINFEKNIIRGDITENTFFNLRNLSKLDLSQQRFTGIKNNAFAHLQTLLNLNLSKNFISTVESLSFNNTSITLLDLSHNKISHLLFLRNCLPNMVEFYINNNNITVIPKYTFVDQTELMRVDLSMNNIISIEEFSLPLNNLQYLNIEGNKINGAIKPNIFSPAKFLRFLDLTYFNVSEIHDFAFDGLPVLAKLNLSNNDIETIEENNFNGLVNLYSLDISYNVIKEFRINSTMLPNIRALHLRNNQLKNMSALFLNQTKLSYIDLSNNNIVNVSGLSNSNTPNLTVLHLNNNKIKYFNNPETNTLVKIIDLGLSSNEITEIDLSYFKDLMSIDLSNNSISSINRTLLEQNEYLQSLDLSENKISDLPPGTFQFMKNLKLVNLSSNNLIKLRYGSLKGLHKTEILDLSKNKITFLDVDVFHECEELKTLIIDYNQIKTFDVERLILVAVKKLRILSLGGNPILCREIVHSIKSSNVTFYAVRQVEVTSIDKIYHEDNVHGIKCGDYPTPVTNTSISDKTDLTPIEVNEKNKGLSATAIALIWCLALTMIVIIGGIILYRKRFLTVTYRSNAMEHLRESSVYQSDLLR